METKVKPVFQVDSSRELEIQKTRLRESCQAFEAVMVSYMMKAMRSGSLWKEDNDSTKEMYEDMLAGQVSKEIARSSVLGIGDMLYSKLEHLLKTQSPKNPKGAPDEGRAASPAPSPDKPAQAGGNRGLDSGSLRSLRAFPASGLRYPATVKPFNISLNNMKKSAD